MADLEFTPKTEKEVSLLLEEGPGSFEVIKSIKKISKTGNSYIALTLKCWDKNGTQGIIFDNLSASDHPFVQRKNRHFCYSVGLENQYEEGKLNAIMCDDKTGNMIIGIQKDKEVDKPDKNCILDYIHIEKNTKNDAPLNDDVPF
jgi:hypothetical protein